MNALDRNREAFAATGITVTGLPERYINDHPENIAVELDRIHEVYTIYPVLGEKARNNGKVVYSLDFEVTPHQLRHTYITNLIFASVDPKTVQYLAGHENSKITMDIYAKAKYNRPKDVAPMLEHVFNQWNEATTK